MTDDNNTAIDAIQIDEDILTYTVSDEALEAAAGTERGAPPSIFPTRGWSGCC
jgi:hypothetical protein